MPQRANEFGAVLSMDEMAVELLICTSYFSVDRMPQKTKEGSVIVMNDTYANFYIKTS